MSDEFDVFNALLYRLDNEAVERMFSASKIFCVFVRNKRFVCICRSVEAERCFVFVHPRDCLLLYSGTVVDF